MAGLSNLPEYDSPREGRPTCAYNPGLNGYFGTLEPPPAEGDDVLPLPDPVKELKGVRVTPLFVQSPDGVEVVPHDFFVRG